jgi:ABC-type transport system involved in cytochrome bd biosynthesis fused ATPase/permease subunit
VWGYPVGKVFLQKKAPFLPALAGILLAGLCHGLFNFLTASPKLLLLGALLILGLWMWVIAKLEGHKRKKRPARAGKKSDKSDFLENKP